MIAGVAALIADPARANMLSALMAGIALTAGELAQAAGITAQTASGHLARLVDAEVVAVQRQGRHRYYQLISPEIAQTMELLSIAATAGPRRHQRPGPKDEALGKARTCYDHIAGQLGLALADAMQARGDVEIMDGTATMTPQGLEFLSTFGAEPDGLSGHHRPLCRACLDWSERRRHLAGRVGTALLISLLARKWIEPVPGSRALNITPLGAAGLAAHFGVQMEPAT